MVARPWDRRREDFLVGNAEINFTLFKSVCTLRAVEGLTKDKILKLAKKIFIFEARGTAPLDADPVVKNRADKEKMPWKMPFTPDTFGFPQAFGQRIQKSQADRDSRMPLCDFRIGPYVQNC